jgi:molecular chaperone HscB
VTDPFATLGLERRYALDLRAAEKHNRELSRALHPDRYVSAGASERRAALARAVEVNEAWRVVRDPVRRAEALFALAGVPVGDGHEPKPSPSLLMDVMDQREALAEAKAKRDQGAIGRLITAMQARETAAQAALGAGLDGRAAAPASPDELAPLAATLGELRYYRRFLEEAQASLDALTDLGTSP